MLIVLGVVLLLSLVILHELGHFLAARRAGIEVEEFGVGFPPRAKVLTEKNGTKYTLNWLPLGGFVKLKGEHDSDTTPGSFGSASLPAKIRVMVAGVIMNYLIAVVIMTFIALIGLPRLIPNQFSVDKDTKVVKSDVLVAVAPDSPASEIGMQDRDIIVSFEAIDCQDNCLYVVEKSADLSAITKSLAGQRAEVVYINGVGEKKNAETRLNSEQAVADSIQENANCIDSGEKRENCPQPKGYFGVVPTDYIVNRYSWSAPIVGFAVTNQFVMETFKGLFNTISELFKGNGSVATEQVTGVIGIGSILGQASSQGIMQVLLLTAIISLSLAVMNILPIPALDGGRLFVTLLFRAINKPLTKQTEERIHGTGFALLMVLFLLITILDVQRFIIN